VRPFELLSLAALLVAPSLPAQDPALVEVLAPVLMSEDRRVLDVAVLAPALEHPDPFVRRITVLAIGRIGDPTGLSLIEQRLYDRDPSVVTETIFALGLIGDPRGVAMISDRIRASDDMTSLALSEAAIALARIGGSEAARLITDVVGGVGNLPPERRDAMIPAAVLEAWRFGREAPVDELRRFTRDTGVDLRWRSVYALARLGAPDALDDFFAATRDRAPLVREQALRALTRRLADSADTRPEPMLEALTQALFDESIGVRITAMRSLATFADSQVADRIIVLLRDRDRTVRIVAAATLGGVGGALTAQALAEAVDDVNADWAVRRTALVSLARVDPAAFGRRAGSWLASRDRFDRLAALEGWGWISGIDPAGFRSGLNSADAATRTAALVAWDSSAPSGDPSLRTAAERAFGDDDPVVRAQALRILADTASDAVLDQIAQAWRSGQADLQEAALRSLIRLARGDRNIVGRLNTPARRALLQRPPDPVLRGIAVQGLPSLAARWGGVGAIETGRNMQDYREVVARLLLAPANPRVVVDVENRGKIEIELLPREAPLTVANFLRLLDRGWFNGVRWHRVVPNFVVQDGDPTGTGNGGPGWSIRDEFNRLHYDIPMVGMALSGPDTGGSQWFINLSAQPHLNGRYTIFGRVVGSYGALLRVQQGDLIRTIQRLGPG
jgi:cyclophilin family peptidyl-prolyl cis-trans isomerase/HEAT repeat protein